MSRLPCENRHPVHGLDKDKQPITHELEYLGSQMKQSVIQGIKHSLKGLATLKKHNHTVGNLRYKSDYVSINLQQYRKTYRFYDEWHIVLQGFKGRIRIKGANQFWNIPGIELANAKLLNLPDGYYLAVNSPAQERFKQSVQSSKVVTESISEISEP